MKLSRIFTVGYAWLLWVVLVFVVVHAPLSVWLGSQFPAFELAIKSWKEIIFLLLLPVGFWLATKHSLWNELKRDVLVQLLAAFVVLHMLMAVIMPTNVEALVAGLFIDLRFAIFFLLLTVAVRVLPRMRWWYVMGSVVMAGFSMLFSLLQVFLLPKDVLAGIGYGKLTIMPYLTVDNNPAVVRINGTFRGPNSVGAYGAMVLAGIAAAFVRKRGSFIWWGIFAAVLALGALVSVWNSYSRSALIATLVAVGIVKGVYYAKRLPLQAWVVAGVAVLVVGIGGFFALQHTDFMTRVILHDDPKTGAEVNSNEAHVESVQSGLRNLVTHPFGVGIGSTGSASLHSGKPFIVENYYLFVAREAGWLGLTLFVAIFAVVLKRLWRARADWLALALFGSGVGLAIVALLLPIWADDTISLVWWGLAAVALAGRKK